MMAARSVDRRRRTSSEGRNLSLPRSILPFSGGGDRSPGLSALPPGWRMRDENMRSGWRDRYYRYCFDTFILAFIFFSITQNLIVYNSDSISTLFFVTLLFFRINYLK